MTMELSTVQHNLEASRHVGIVKWGWKFSKSPSTTDVRPYVLHLATVGAATSHHGCQFSSHVLTGVCNQQIKITEFASNKRPLSRAKPRCAGQLGNPSLTTHGRYTGGLPLPIPIDSGRKFDLPGNIVCHYEQHVT